jgi:hypothetical protein
MAIKNWHSKDARGAIFDPSMLLDFFQGDSIGRIGFQHPHEQVLYLVGYSSKLTELIAPVERHSRVLFVLHRFHPLCCGKWKLGIQESVEADTKRVHVGSKRAVFASKEHFCNGASVGL